MIKKMEKQIYVAPLLEVLPKMWVAVLSDSLPEFEENEKGEYLSNDSFFDTSDGPDHGSLWDEDEE